VSTAVPGGFAGGIDPTARSQRAPPEVVASTQSSVTSTKDTVDSSMGSCVFTGKYMAPALMFVDTPYGADSHALTRGALILCDQILTL